MSKTRFGARKCCIVLSAALVGSSLGCQSPASKGKREPACPCMAAARNKEPVVIQLPPVREPARVNRTAEADSSPVSTTAEPAKARVIQVYYFHRTMRCETCLQIEAWAKEAIEARFADELARGQVQWLAINFEQPENKHFVEEYKLKAQALVIVSQGEEKPKDLDQIWDLAGDRGRFSAYVVNEVSAALGKPADAEK